MLGPQKSLEFLSNILQRQSKNNKNKEIFYQYQTQKSFFLQFLRNDFCLILAEK